MTRSALLKSAFVNSIPVLAGYSAMGFSAGVLLTTHSGASHPILLAFLTSTTCISGALQFMLAEWFRTMPFLWNAALLTLCLNVRYAMYGLSLLDRFRDAGILRKFYLIWTLTDETFALEVRAKSLTGTDYLFYCTVLAALDHFYWVAGVVCGALSGAALPFSNRGIDFAMTALFLVILTEQCSEKENRIFAAVGLVIPIMTALLLGTDRMLPPAIALMVAFLLVFRKKLMPFSGDQSEKDKLMSVPGNTTEKNPS